MGAGRPDHGPVWVRAGRIMVRYGCGPAGSWSGKGADPGPRRRGRPPRVAAAVAASRILFDPSRAPPEPPGPRRRGRPPRMCGISGSAVSRAPAGRVSCAGATQGCAIYVL
eukprot:gene21072-biopygen4126